MEPAVVFAIAVLSSLCILAIIALLRYQVEDALKVLTVLVGLFGATVGAAGTYFFTRGEAETLEEQASTAKQEAKTAEETNQALKAILGSYSQVQQLPSSTREKLKKNEEIRETLNLRPTEFTTMDNKTLWNVARGYEHILDKARTQL